MAVSADAERGPAPRIHLCTLGCRLNQAEMDALGGRLMADGVALTAAGQADVIVLNTCAVTAEAARDARRLVRRWHRERPEAAIVLTGCQATLTPEALTALPGVTAVVGNGDKEGLADWIHDRTGRPAAGSRSATAMEAAVLPPARGRTRAFVAVQDGCDQRCAFCATTVARGAARSRHRADIVLQIGALAAAGYQEAVLTGVQLGAYGKDLGLGGDGLTGLIRSLLQDRRLPRLRLSSLEPWDLHPSLIALWADERLMPQLHLPIQTGSDALRRRMARRGRVDSLRRWVEAARAAIPGLALGTDVIAGLPGETDADHEATLKLLRELGFCRLHVFPYSPREGTAAAAMAGQVAAALRRERSTELAALGRDLARRHAAGLAGQLRPILWEAPGDATDALGRRRWSGLAPDGSRVSCWSAADLWNRILPARLALDGDGAAACGAGLGGSGAGVPGEGGPDAAGLASDELPGVIDLD